jgi:hypothetical protein
MTNFTSHNKIKEILEFAQFEPESTEDLAGMVCELNPEELRALRKITQNLQTALNENN